MLKNETMQTIFGCRSGEVAGFLGTGFDAIFEFRSEPRISSRISFTIDIPNRTVVYNPFTQYLPLPELAPGITDDDCQWALDTHLETFVGGKDEGEVYLDYLAGHYQGIAIGKCARNRPNDIVVCGDGGNW